MGDNLINIILLSLGLAGGLYFCYPEVLPKVHYADPLKLINLPLEEMKEKLALSDMKLVLKNDEIAQLLLSKNSELASKDAQIERMFKSLSTISDRCDAQAILLENMDSAVSLISIGTQMP
tara:strand:+ start:1654 stop:2016 length:363 start_codon:yes stop_codon:yes gene_type:complete